MDYVRMYHGRYSTVAVSEAYCLYSSSFSSLPTLWDHHFTMPSSPDCLPDLYMELSYLTASSTWLFQKRTKTSTREMVFNLLTKPGYLLLLLPHVWHHHPSKCTLGITFDTCPTLISMEPTTQSLWHSLLNLKFFYFSSLPLPTQPKLPS